MGKRTKKVGAAGKYGARYGVRVRKRLKEIEEEKADWYTCPKCNHKSVRRAGTGIWKCRRCDLVFAGGAYKPVVSPGFVREITTESEGLEKNPKGEE